MKQLFGICLILPLLCTKVGAAPVHSQMLKPKLVLESIQVKQQQEKMGDELYFDISTHRTKQARQYDRVPEYPLNWSSTQLDKASRTVLWSEPLKDGESVYLVVSLMEQDAKPLNPDDLLGSMRIRLKNMKGVLKAEWDMPNRDMSSKELVFHGKSQSFMFSRDGGSYKVLFSLKS